MTEKITTITVLTATLNADRHLARLISSLIAQTDQDFEWLVVDGCSTDGTIDMVKGHTGLHTRCLVGKDFGIYDALNRGVQAIESGYYLVVGADDTLAPDAIRQYRNAALNGFPDIVAAAVVQGGHIVLPKRGMGWLYGMPGIASSHAVGTLIKVDLHRRFGIYSRRLPIAADQLFVKRALYGGASIQRCSFVAGEFSTEGTSGADPVGLLTEVFRVQLLTERSKLLQLFLFALRLSKLFILSHSTLNSVGIVTSRKNAEVSKDLRKASSVKKVRIHLTNVIGTGASQLAASLLPQLESNPHTSVEAVYLPDSGLLKDYSSLNPSTTVRVYRRWLPRMLSRLLECTLLSRQFDGETPLFVMGDLPMRCRSPQTVFVQTPHIPIPEKNKLSYRNFKFWISRAVFRLNMDRVRAFIVQTDVMKNSLANSYPSIASRIHVVAQPVPSWLLGSNLRRETRAQHGSDLLYLFYPAAGYPHKNHALLSSVDPESRWPVRELVLTLDDSFNPARQLPWVRCCGFLSPTEMMQIYSEVDALVFLSKEESYGFPLVEAMFIGLPIVCPDLPYARTLCGSEAVYFDPDNLESLLSALSILHVKLRKGWWPDWSDRLANIPVDWQTVADDMLAITCDSYSPLGID